MTNSVVGRFREIVVNLPRSVGPSRLLDSRTGTWRPASERQPDPRFSARQRIGSRSSPVAGYSKVVDMRMVSVVPDYVLSGTTLTRS